MHHGYHTRKLDSFLDDALEIDAVRKKRPITVCYEYLQRYLWSRRQKLPHGRNVRTAGFCGVDPELVALGLCAECGCAARSALLTERPMFLLCLESLVISANPLRLAATFLVLKKAR